MNRPVLKLREERGIVYADFNVRMFDIDVKGPGHLMNDVVTASSKGEATERLIATAWKYNFPMAIAYTRSGVHGYDLSGFFRCNEATAEAMKFAQCDPRYIICSLERSWWADRWSPKVLEDGSYRQEDLPVVSMIAGPKSNLNPLCVTFLEVRRTFMEQQWAAAFNVKAANSSR